MGKGGGVTQWLDEQDPSAGPDDEAEIREDYSRYEPPVIRLAKHAPQVAEVDSPE